MIDATAQTNVYNVLNDVNTILSEPILSHEVVGSCIMHLEKYTNALDDELEMLQIGLNKNVVDSSFCMSMKEIFHSLVQDIESMQSRALEMENLVTEITTDIRQLDYARRNIISSMIVLKRLQMLTIAYEQLKALVKAKQYGEITHLLEAVLELTSYFKSFRSVDQIAILCNNIYELKKDLLEQASLDFENIFSSSLDLNKKASQLQEICIMIDTLENKARERILLWYCNTQLREYRAVFRGNDEAASLDNISRRYAWIKRMLKLYDEKHSKMFPESWNTDERLCHNFCINTSEDIRDVLSKSGRNCKITIFIEALEKTLEFEQFLEKRFIFDHCSLTDSVVPKQNGKTLTFHKIIRNTFDPYLNIFIESQENILSSMIQSFKKIDLENEIKNNAQLIVTSSSTELFLSYRETLTQYEKLLDGRLLLELSYLFGKWLIIYAETILLPVIDGRQTLNINTCCLVLNTSDYCYKTTVQLETLIKSKIIDDFREKVNFTKEEEMFLNIAGVSIKSLVKIVEANLSGPFKDMVKIDWSQLENIVDQSAYVIGITSVLKDMSKKIIEKIPIEKFVRTFCDKIVESFLDNFIFYITRSRPISEIGAEQMISDLYSIKMTLLKLPVITNKKNAQAHISYTKFVNKGISRIETILKVLLTQINSSEEFVNNYFIWIGDKNASNFLKILELKGIRKQEQNQLLDIFNIQVSEHSDLIDSSPLLESLVLSSQTGPNTGLSSRFDASNISSIFSITRENFERLPRNSTLSNSETLPSSGSRLNERFKGLFRRDSSSGTSPSSKESYFKPNYVS
ncbi:uncharacterized protein T551_02826 [Pneumocystis jirovecii RU7]|uniref:Uncharacterized protein n=1 Tax=Pneumocystis jirovecii (strain RU7) TaxID=1408657 RepID=A0A0W4ZHL1_PNEJ7|nr:uncharacterized protein T551_02826 [Pneumocystis jirovecii RU7]KTW27859.1 hypothetical protein T551_02826 [Pneumocystis jirovecii RU7]